MAKKKNGRGPLRLLGRIISSSLYLLIILVVTWLIITFIGQKTIVSGSSMENTLSDGDQIIVDKISYRFDRPKRYDIVVFPYPHNKSKLYIKRIIGMHGNILINLCPLRRRKRRLTLSDDEYFVLGDNRNDSQDSRDSMVGNIKKEEFVGKAWARIWPLDRMGKLRHQ